MPEKKCVQPEIGHLQQNVVVTTVEPVLRGHPKLDKTKIFVRNGSLMKVESDTECSP